MRIYAVRVGRKTGIFTDVNEYNSSIKGYSNAEGQKFKTIEEAEIYMSKKKKSNINLKYRKNLKNFAAFNNFNIDSELHAHIDGSYIKNKNFFSYSVIFTDIHGDLIETMSGTSNVFIEYKSVAAELYAACMAIQYAIIKEYKEITLHFDCKSIGIEQNLKHFKSPIIKSYINFINSIKDLIKINYSYNKAHSGHFYNDNADNMAKKVGQLVDSLEYRKNLVKEKYNINSLNDYTKNNNQDTSFSNINFGLNIHYNFNNNEKRKKIYTDENFQVYNDFYNQNRAKKFNKLFNKIYEINEDSNNLFDYL